MKFALESHWRAFDSAFGGHPHLICYAVKANSNLAILNVFARLGAGFDKNSTFGSNLAAPVWTEVMKAAYRTRPATMTDKEIQAFNARASQNDDHPAGPIYRARRRPS